MAQRRKRIGREDSPSREAFLDATARLLYERGYGSISAGAIAELAGFKKQLLYYYFDSVDELIAETHKRFLDAFHKSLDEVFETEAPQRALWRLLTSGNARLFTEFLAIANHNPVLRATIAEASARTNAVQVEKLTTLMQRAGVDLEAAPPRAVNFILSAVTRNLLIERELGLLEDEAELDAMMEAWFNRLFVGGDPISG
jgi:AcrR family transcriptional regulator